MSGNSSRHGQEDNQGPPHLVLIFHAYALVNTPWVAHALSHCTLIRYGRIASISAARDATQFGDSICPVCVSIF
jgi:hypothetical protein